METLAGGEEAAGHAEVDFGPGDAAGEEVVQASGVNAAWRTRCSSSCGRTYRSTSDGFVERPGSRPGDHPEKYPTLFEIEVNWNLPLLDRYVTLAPELGHLLCGHLGSGPEDAWPDRFLPKTVEVHARNEAEAESIAYIVLKRLDPDVQMGDYITGYLDPNQQVPETVALNLAFKVAGLITEMGGDKIRQSMVKCSVRSNSKRLLKSASPRT